MTASKINVNPVPWHILIKKPDRTRLLGIISRVFLISQSAIFPPRPAGSYPHYISPAISCLTGPLWRLQSSGQEQYRRYVYSSLPKSLRFMTQHPLNVYVGKLRGGGEGSRGTAEMNCLQSKSQQQRWNAVFLHSLLSHLHWRNLTLVRDESESFLLLSLQVLNQTSRLEIQLLENSLSTNKLEKELMIQTNEISKLHDKNR